MDHQAEKVPSPTWKDLAEKASKEQDPFRLMKLVEQMLAAMDKDRRLAKPRADPKIEP